MGKGKSKPLKPDLNEWRKTDWFSKEAMLDSMKKYQPQNSSIKHVRILLHGPVGSGKSSFINSVNNIFQGRMTHGAHVATVSGESYTKKYKTHEIEKEDAQHFYPIVFNDIMGFEAQGGIEEEDIKLIMKGHVKDGYPFNPASAITDKDSLYNHHPTMDDRIHVLVSVVTAANVDIMDQDVISKMRRIRHTASELDIPQICIITKIDEVHDLIKNDVRNVYKLKILKDKMEAFSNAVGIPVNCIFPVKNYHEEIDLNHDVDVLILKALKPIIDFGEDFINGVMKADPKLTSV